MLANYLFIAEVAEQNILAAASRAHPVETGGILAGVCADGIPWITHSVEISRALRDEHSYLLPEGATHPAIDELRKLDSRIGYLGDWHSHPAPFGPSRIDRGTMAKVAQVDRPIALILARFERDGYALVPYLVSPNVFMRVRFTRTGSLVTG